MGKYGKQTRSFHCFIDHFDINLNELFINKGLYTGCAEKISEGLSCKS